MHPEQHTKEANLVVPQSIATSEVTGYVDTLGYDYATLRVRYDTASTSTTISTLTVSEGDSTSAYTAISALTAGTATGNFTAPTAPGTSGTGQIVKLHVDLKTRKRYLKLALANSAARITMADVELSRAKDAPDTDSERGCAEIVIA